MNVVVIPARGGSKRIPGKNIKEFCGKPIIAWPIEVAKKSGLFDHIIVSTDDCKIAEVAKSYGAETPFVRPANLSDDFATTGEVMAHAAQWLGENNYGKICAICCIYATSVFLTVDALKQGFEAIKSGKWKYAFSVTDFAYPIFRSLKETSNGEVEMFFPEHFSKRSQDLPNALHDAAQFYWGNTDAWLKNIKLFEKHSCQIKMPTWCIQDIDTTEDWKRAEIVFKMINNDK